MAAPPRSTEALRQALVEAMRLHGLGRYDEAIAALDRGSALKTMIGQNIVGDIHLKRGKHREALKAFDAAIRLEPAAPEPYANRGVALQAIGRLEEALAAEDRALRLRSDYAKAHFNRGNILKELKRYDDAIGAYDRVLRSQPAMAEAHLNRGSALLELRRPVEALNDFGRALQHRPKYAAAHLGRAAAFRDLGSTEEALSAATAALALDSTDLQAIQFRYAVLLAAERYEEALAAVDASRAAGGSVALVNAMRAVTLSKLQRMEEAVAAADAAVAADSTHAEAHAVRGFVLGAVGRLDESIAAFEQSEKLGPLSAEHLSARAVVLAALGRTEEADAASARAVGLAPDSPAEHKNRSYLCLSIGNWESGWREHEWRLKETDHPGRRFGQWAPPWKGEDLREKRLLIYTEQGYGDAIQFVRYVPFLWETGAIITLVGPEALRRLFMTSFPQIEVTDLSAPRLAVDYQTSAMSLPYILGTTPVSVPREVPYLSADKDLVAKWNSRLGNEGFKVGIAWQGNPKYPRDWARSIPLLEFAPLAAVPGVRLISLQSGFGTEQLRAVTATMKVEELGEEVVANPDGFRQVAAVMNNLDLVVISDTGPAHLAGALARPTWLMLGRHPDWRWMREGEDTLWYPTMRLFRQEFIGDWRNVFERLALELAREVTERGRGPSA